jgi:cytochrome c peroxidase
MTGLAVRDSWLAIATVAAFACTEYRPTTPRLETPNELPAEVRERLAALSPLELPLPPADPTNAYADNAAAAALGHKFFFETRFSGPLLDSANNGTTGALGRVGETGKVSCTGCHVPSGDFNDMRSPRRQLSLGAGWTHRKAPSLLNVGHETLLTWDGRRDAGYNQPFAVIESAAEFNSSRLFVAQQIAALYADDYEAVFGPLPDLSAFDPIVAADAGCAELTEFPAPSCPKPGHDDPQVIRVIVNFGKALHAYQRLLSCGSSRFDAWMHGDADALTVEEKAGAVLFVTKGKCDTCHSGPYLTDHQFHNVGVAASDSLFTPKVEDLGASVGLATALNDPLNSASPSSDGSDGRLDGFPDPSSLLGAFRTPGLRCVGRRPSFFHAGQYRSLVDVVAFFDRGGAPAGYSGTSEIAALGLTAEERAQLVAFLHALAGPGAEDRWVEPPVLP